MEGETNQGFAGQSSNELESTEQEKAYFTAELSERDSPHNASEIPPKDEYSDDHEPETQEEVTKSLLSESNERDTELLNCFHCKSFLKSYRSTNPQSRITPFAIVLLIVLLLIYVLNQADRLVLAVLIPSGLKCTGNSTQDNDTCYTNNAPLNNISNETTISNPDCIPFNDYEQGLLTGPAFVVVYVIAGLPLAYLADTRSRSFVLLLGVLFWSIMVILTGFIHEFWELLLLRVLLGVGEASYNPVAYSLLADFFPIQNRASVFAVYNYGVYFGGSFGWMSGAINSELDWRWTFRLLGIAGIAMLPLAMLALWEPKKVREKRKQRIRGKSSYTVWEVIKYLIKCPPYLILIVAGSIRNISGYALGYWLPTYYARAFGLHSGQYGPKVGLVVLFGGGIGCFIGGVLSDWHRQGAKAYIISVSQLLATPAIIGVLLAETPDVSYGILVVAYITAETWLGPAAAIVQDIALPAIRAQAAAVYIGIITIVASIGPVLVPLFLNNIPSFAGCTGLRYALLCTVPTFYLLSSILFAVLGVVTKYWAVRVKNKARDSYASFTDEIAGPQERNSFTSNSSTPSNEW